MRWQRSLSKQATCFRVVNYWSQTHLQYKNSPILDLSSTYGLLLCSGSFPACCSLGSYFIVMTEQKRALLECEDCGCKSRAELQVWLCADCGCTYCDSCWDNQPPHRKGRVDKNGRLHEKDNKEFSDRIRLCFDSPTSHEEKRRAHLDDEETRWFGVDTLQNNKDTDQSIFSDSGRYSILMTRTKQVSDGERYPRLVSFVGQTGMIVKSFEASLTEQR